MGSPTSIPMQQQPSNAEITNPQAYEDYVRAVAAQQANTTGLTQMAPATGLAQPPTQRQFQQPGPQSARTFGPGEGAARKREAMSNLVKTGQSLANQIGQMHQQRQQRDYQLTLGRYTSAVAGIQQAQAQLQQAQAMLRQNPQDPQARQMLQNAQLAFRTNQTNLNDLANDKKAAKIIQKAYGVDDKNANSPERQALTQLYQKQMGVGQQAAQMMSQIPQTQQLSPEATSQQQARQAGAIGKPATQGEILTAFSRGADQLMKQGVSLDRLELEGQKRGLVLQRDASGNIQYNPDGSPQWRPMTQQELNENPVQRAQADFRAAQTAAMKASADAKTNPQNPDMQIKAAEAQARMLSARAAMLRAQKYVPGSGREGNTTGDPGNLVDEIGTGKIAPERMSYLLTRNPQLMQDVAKKYPDFDSSKAAAYPRVYEEFTSGPIGKELTAGATALEHMQELKELNTPDSLIPYTAAWTAYQSKANQVAVELAGFYGTNTEMAVNNYLKTLASNLPKNRDAAIRTQAQSMGDRLHNFAQQWKNAAPSPAYEAPMPGLSDQAIQAWKNLDPNYTPLEGSSSAPSPPSASQFDFSVSAWKAKNPRATDADIEAVKKQAAASGYTVVE